MTVSALVEVERVDPRWGEDYQLGRVAYVTPQGIAVWMHRRGQHVRFFDARGNQIGPEHKNVVPACVWASAHAWIDPTSPNLSIACIAEVRGQIAERAAMPPKVRRVFDQERPEFAAAAVTR